MMHRFHAWLSGLSAPAKGFVSQPEPKTIGSVARGRQLVAGNFLFAGFLVQARDRSIWDLPMPDRRFEDELHGFRWLDDLAASGDPMARMRAQDWTFDWLERFGAGRGPGWTPDLTGRRVIRLINHAILLLHGQDRAASQRYFRSLGRQTVFLSRRWQTAAAGLPRFEALTGLVYAGLSLTGMERRTGPAAHALARECVRRIEAEGGLPTRNPEELLEIFSLLNWAATALSESGRTPPPALVSAIVRIAPILRSLRHADGGLARFHGGGRGLEGRLDQALADSGVPAAPARSLAMGYARMAEGRTTVIMDAAAPPKGTVSSNAHASTLAFELTSGRRPLVVNCGSGASFGAEWRRAGRATPSHSTLSIAGYSSALFERDPRGGRRALDLLAEVPRQVWAQHESDEAGVRLLSGHDGYAPTHGMTHIRQLHLSLDGRVLKGEDTLGAMSAADRKRFDTVMERTRFEGIPFAIRFHLHPDVDAALDLGGTAVSMALKSGEIWIFRHDGVADLTLEASVYLESGRLKPRPTRQIVLKSAVLDYARQISWTLAKAQDTPAAIRDTYRGDDVTDDEG